MVANRKPGWVLLNYRIPREPSTPRIAVWRKLKTLGVAQLGEGLVALPVSDRNREQLEWVAVRVQQAGGEAIVWLADPAAPGVGPQLKASMIADRDAEYQVLVDEIAAADSVDGRTTKRWKSTWRSIQRRDYFKSSLATHARLAINDLAHSADPLTNDPLTKDGAPR